MRIALTNPTAWPHERRGGERLFHELASYLAARGHEVTLLSSRPGRRRVVRSNGYTLVYHRRLWHPALTRLGIWHFHTFCLSLFPSLLRRRYDVIHCGTFVDTYAAILARRVTGVPCVLLVPGMPPPVRYYRSLTLGGVVFRRAMRDADEVMAVSAYMQRYLEGRFGRPGARIPVPVDMDAFPLSRTRDHQRPIVLCTAALEDKRKGGSVLMRAFDGLKRLHPEAVLQIASAVNEATRQRLLALLSPRWHRDVQFLGTGDLADLPATYGRAAISVLPSLWEAFGMVVIESLATGTPVVGTRDGAIPEILDDERIGRLFDPGSADAVEPTNAAGLVRAMADALELSRAPETAERCRAHAERYSWSRIGPRFEELYARLVEKRQSTPLRARACT